MSEREDRSRLSEIMQVLRRYRITKGITPVKVREILEELGRAAEAALSGQSNAI